MSRQTTVTIVLVVGVLLVLLWLSRDRLMPGASRAFARHDRALLRIPAVRPRLSSRRGAIGNSPRGEERPQIAHVAISDLDRDGLSDVLVCDSSATS